MSETIRNDLGYIGYEYKEVTVRQELASLYADSYPNFGWELEGASVPSLASIFNGFFLVNMKFKRDRRLHNKAELTRLQRQFDSLANEIVALERSKTVGAAATAYIIGIVGTAFMAGSVFAYLGNMLPLSIVLALPALVGWIIPYFCYLRIRTTKTTRVEPFIDQKHDEVYDICGKAHSLLKS